MRKTKPTANPTVQPSFVTVDDWCSISGMRKASVYVALARGDLRAKKAGARTLIDVRHGMTYLEGLPDFRPRQPDLGLRYARQ